MWRMNWDDSRIRRPLLARGHQAARGSLSITDPISFLNIQSPVHQSLSLPIDKSAVHPSAGLNLLFAGLQVQVSHRTPGVQFYPPGQGVSQPWGVSGETLKFNEIPMNLEYPKNHQIGLPRHSKVSKMMSKLVPKIINFTKQ